MKNKLNDTKKIIDNTILKILNLYISTFTSLNCKEERKKLIHYALDLIIQRKNVILISSNLDMLSNNVDSLSLTAYTLIYIREYIDTILDGLGSTGIMLQCKTRHKCCYLNERDQKLENIYIEMISGMIDSTKHCIKLEKQKVKKKRD